MKSQTQLKQALKEVVDNINKFNDKVVDAMCDGNDYKEQQYQEEIVNLEYKKSVLEWVLN
jgi:hypothetical protein